MSLSANDDLFENFENHFEIEYFTTKLRDPFMKIRDKNTNYSRVIKVQSSEFDGIIYSFLSKSKTSRRKKEIVLSFKDEIISKCLTSETIKDIKIRSVFDGLKVTIDLSKGQFCEITSEKVSLKSQSDITFWRPPRISDMPVPNMVYTGQLIEFLKDSINSFNHNDYLLILAFIIKAIAQDNTSMPILLIQGEQGSGKTTLSKLIRRLIDNNNPPLISCPKTEQDLFINANASSVLAFDNLSRLSPDLSDSFCKLSTGGGTSTRKLYSDSDEIVFDQIKPVIFNGIDNITNRADFLDRAVIIRLSKRTDSARKSESLFWKEFEDNYHVYLGDLYCIISRILKELPKVRNHNLPRMTEYARIGIALSRVIEIEEADFENVYSSNSQEKKNDIFFDDPICQSIEKLINTHGYLHGSNMELINKIKESFKFEGLEAFIRYDSGLKNSLSFSSHISRLTPVLNSRGIEVKRSRDAHRRSITFYRTDSPPNFSNLTSAKSIYHEIGPL